MDERDVELLLLKSRQAILEEVEKRIDRRGFATKEEIAPMKRLVYGATGVLLAALLLAMVGLALKG